jgi:Ca2+-dependent lipid-binding protein
MKSQVLMISAFLVVLAALSVEGRDLKVEVISGEVQSKDTFNSDPYVSVTVCKEKKKTQTVSRTRTPSWNWSHNVCF